MTLGKLQANSVISAYQNTANQNPRVSEDAKKLGLKDEQIVGKNESRYELDGTLKEEHKIFGMPETDKAKKAEEDGFVHPEEEHKADSAEHSKHKADGFDKDCPECQCETCKNRRYKDDSNDSAVSFQSATKMDPSTAAFRVRGHEMEHVRRESIKAENEGKKVVSQTVQIKTDTCDECGRIYVAGGLTRTRTRIDMTDFRKTFMLGFDGSDVKTG
ncbi:MAG: hypothetical protein IJX15_02375 [Ruminiclostridium sp.]|nr:hypothetical protein [Ruminiclostridium sp.]